MAPVNHIFVKEGSKLPDIHQRPRVQFGMAKCQKHGCISGVLYSRTAMTQQAISPNGCKHQSLEHNKLEKLFLDNEHVSVHEILQVNISVSMHLWFQKVSARWVQKMLIQI
jgi:hypothetical protein